MIRTIIGEGKNISASQSLINGRVIPKGSDKETVFGLDKGVGDINSEIIQKMERSIVEGRLDVVLCYCSVYDQCWKASIQEVIRSFQGKAAPKREVISIKQCEAMETSGIYSNAFPSQLKSAP